MIPIVIVTGFLGSGKTTFMQRFLPYCGEAGLRPALIINDAGAMDVDGQILAELRAEQVTLLGGCICCSLQADLTLNTEILINRNAGDMIIIECSGFSSPLEVIKALSDTRLKGKITITHVICVVDSSRFQKLPEVVDLVKEQIAPADTLIINKTDRLQPERKNHVEQLLTKIAPPFAKIYWTSYSDIASTALRELVDSPAERVSEAHTESGNTSRDDGQFHRLPSNYSTITLPIPPTLERQDLERLMNELPRNIIRAKGFVNIHPEGWQVVQRSFDWTEISPYKGGSVNVESSLVCIGYGLDGDEITRFVNGFCLNNVVAE